MKSGLAVWLRFNAVGVMGVGIQLAVLAILKTGFGLNVLLATVLAVESAILHNFVWHERWTWANRGLDMSHTLRRLVRFNAGNGLISLVGNFVLMWLLVSRLGMNYLVANVLAIAACSIANFLVSDRLVFR